MSYIVQGHTASNYGAKNWIWTSDVDTLNHFTDAVIAHLLSPTHLHACFFVAYTASILSISLLESQKIRMQEEQEKKEWKERLALERKYSETMLDIKQFYLYISRKFWIQSIVTLENLGENENDLE